MDKEVLEKLVNNNLGKTNYFTIYLGKIVSDVIFNKIMYKYDKIIEKYKLNNPKFKKIKYKQYNYNNLKLIISNKLTCTKNVIVDTKNISLSESDIDCHLTFWNVSNIDSSSFTCQLEYHNEIQTEKTVFNFNNNISIIFENNSIYIDHKIQPNSLKFLDQIISCINELHQIIKMYNNTNET